MQGPAVFLTFSWLQVLDDSRTLHLLNGDAIPLPSTARIIFEADTLASASPATIARCGVAQLEPAALGWRPLLATWLPSLPLALPPAAAKHVATLFDAFLPPLLRFVRTEVRELSPTYDSTLAVAAMRLVKAQLDALPTSITASSGATAAAEAAFVFAATWGIGATGSGDDRRKFDAFARCLFGGGTPQVLKPLFCCFGQTDYSRSLPAHCWQT